MTTPRQEVPFVPNRIRFSDGLRIEPQAGSSGSFALQAPIPPGGTEFSLEQAAQVAEAIRAAGPRGLPLPMFATGLELWISPAWLGNNWNFQAVGQVQSLTGPTVEVSTLQKENPVTVVDSAPMGRTTAGGSVLVRTPFNVVYPEWEGRLYYNPELTEQTSEHGLLGSALYGAQLFVAIVYRRPEFGDYIALPDFVLEWIGHAGCTKFQQVLSNGVRYIDFKMEWYSVPLLYQQSLPGQAASPLLNPTGETLPPIADIRVPINVPYTWGAPLPAVSGSRTWVYTLFGLPQGLSFSPGSRVITGQVSSGGISTIRYVATSGSDTRTRTFYLIAGGE